MSAWPGVIGIFLIVRGFLDNAWFAMRRIKKEVSMETSPINIPRH
jgi:hypothetical protein